VEYQTASIRYELHLAAAGDTSQVSPTPAVSRSADPLLLLQFIVVFSSFGCQDMPLPGCCLLNQSVRS